MTKKDYLCKDCEHNNNGWCPIIERNGLKNITSCANKNPTTSLTFGSVPITTASSTEKSYNEVIQDLKIKAKNKIIYPIPYNPNEYNDIFNILKDNLGIRLDTSKEDGQTRVTVNLLFNGEVIADDDIFIK